MKTKILILLAIIVGTHCNVSLQGQELPDTVWTKEINSVQIAKFSPDGQFVFAGLIYFKNNHDIYKIETLTGTIVDTFKCNKMYLNNISISPTGDTLLESGTGHICLWDVKTGDTIFTLPYGEHACITPDGKKIVTTTGEIGTDKAQILVIDIASREIIKTFIGSYYDVDGLDISPDGKYFAFHDSRGVTANVVLVDLSTFKEIKVFVNPNGSLDHPSFSSDSKYLITNTAGQEFLCIWDLEKLILHKTIIYEEKLNIINSSISFPHFSNNGKFIIFSFFDIDDYNSQKVVVWDIVRDLVVHEYLFSAKYLIDVSKDDYIATVGYTAVNGWHVNLLRPKWTETDVIEQETEIFNYILNNGILKIKFEETITEKPEINIYNILGVAVGTWHAVPLQNSNEIEIDLNYLNSGVYFVVVDVGGKRRVVKVIKD